MDGVLPLAARWCSYRHDALEVTAPPAGHYPVTDGSSLFVLDTAGTGLRRHWAKRFLTDHTAMLQQLCRRYQAHLIGLRTDQAVGEVLRQGLRPQGRRQEDPLNTQPASTAALADALQGLRDYHLPEAVSWWPACTGLVDAAHVCSPGFAVFAWWLLRQHRRRAAARRTIRELTVLRTALKQQRRCGVPAWGVEAAASLHVLAGIAPGRQPR